MPVYLDLYETRHFAEYLAEQIRLYFTLHDFEVANHTKWTDGEVYEFQKENHIVSLLIRQADLEHIRITMESEEEYSRVQEVIEDALVKTVTSITEKVFKAYAGDVHRLHVRLISHLQELLEHLDE